MPAVEGEHEGLAVAGDGATVVRGRTPGEATRGGGRGVADDWEGTGRGRDGRKDRRLEDDSFWRGNE